MKTLNGLPLFQMTIDEFDNQTGVEFISLVDQPAIEVNWVAFSDDKKIKRYAFDKDKQMLMGPAMIPDLPIYRFDEQMGEYYVTFTKEEIEKIGRKFMREQRTLGINYQHQSNSQVSSAVITELWYITDKDKDKSTHYGFNLPVGTMMVATHIADSKFWNDEVKSGNIRGYSIEGFLNLEMSKDINKNKIKNHMSKMKMKADIKTTEGVVISTPADSFVEGSEVYVVDADGNETPVADGDHTLENGVMITVEGGKIKTMVEPTSQATEVAYEITPEDIQMITEAVQPLIDALAERITALETQVADLTAANTEMKTIMSKIPGGVAMSTKSDKDKTEPVSKATAFQDKLKKIQEFKKASGK